MEEPDYFWHIIDEKEIEETLKNDDLPTAAGKIQEYLEQASNEKLNIGITGESGSGKSSFVNAFIGLEDEDDNSAPTGPVETTKEPKPFPHPKFPNVQLWDLPGIGTPNFNPENYLTNVEFDRYEFFIIVSSDRFRVNDVNLAKEIQKMGKRFYFVRSKIDNSLAAERRKKGFNEEKTLQLIREDCITGLTESGVTSPKVFLISSWELHLYDFPALQETMERELPQHKKHVLLLAVPNISLKIHAKKKAAFQAKIWMIAAVSGVVAVAPVLGLSFAVDASLLLAEVMRYYQAFGLDNKSLQTLSNRTGVPMEELKSVLKSPFNKEISKDVIIKMLTKSVGGAAMVAEEVSHYFIGIGSLLAASISFTTTYCMLRSCLNELADDAQNVLMKALNR